MKALVAGLASALVLWPSAVLASWDWSGFPGEERQSVIGCSDAHTDESWLCLAVRCDAPGDLNLYIELTNLDVRGTLYVVVDDQRFTVNATTETDAPYSSRLDGDINAILAALKAGSEVFLGGPEYRFTSGYDTVPLRGSGRAISALEVQCGVANVRQTAAAGAGPVSASMLPLQPGIYVRTTTTCEGLSHATTLNFTGDHINAQRVIGKILSVREEGGLYQVKVSGHDIAEDVDIGDLDWTLKIPSSTEFTFAGDGSGESYRRCFDQMPSSAPIS